MRIPRGQILDWYLWRSRFFFDSRFRERDAVKAQLDAISIRRFACISCHVYM